MLFAVLTQVLTACRAITSGSPKVGGTPKQNEADLLRNLPPLDKKKLLPPPKRPVRPLPLAMAQTASVHLSQVPIPLQLMVDLLYCNSNS